MYKAVGFLILLVLFSCSSVQTIGQVTATESRPSGEANTEAQRLIKEGIELTGAGQMAQAIRAFEEAIKLDPQSPDAYAALGRAYFKMREWRRAVDYLHRASALKAKQREAKSAAQQAKVHIPTAPAAQTPQIEATESTRQPEKQADAPAVLIPTPSGPPASSELVEVKTQPIEPIEPQITKPQPQKAPDPGTTAIPTSTTPPTKPNAVEVTQPTSPEVTQAEKPAEDVSPSKSDAASAPEEKQEPTGVSVAMSAPPVASTVESRGVTPIPLELSNEDVSLTKVYRVGPGDVLDVRINEGQPQQSTLFTVTSTGLLEHPLLPEPLPVSTLTTEEIETKIQEDLKKRALSENPAVSVGVRDYASHAILVSGLVKDSGTKFLRREAIPLYVVVADAQPLPEAAKVTVVRNELNQMFEISLTNVADMNLLVRPGDVINLQPNETEFIYVGGKVKTPGEKIFRRGLTLTQAILSAGGVTSKSKVAEIGRDDGRGFLTKTSFNLKDIHTGKIMDPLIKAGDRIMILR